MTHIKSMAAAAVAVLIAGCGGGSDSAPAGNSPPAAISVQGSVVKGPMAKAKISLYKVGADGKQGELLQETESDNNGAYSVTLSNYSGVVIAVASVVPGKTMMYDEAMGQAINPAADFILRASFSAESGKTSNAQINPFTEVATVAALAKSGGLTLANVEQANSELATALGFNPLTAVPTFDADKNPTNNAAGALAAVSHLALSNGLGCAASDQAAKIACVTKALSAKGLGDASTKTALQAALNLVNDNAGLPAVSIGSGDTPAAVPTALEQAKAFMGALRSNAKALDATDLSLQTELQKVADDVYGRAAPLASSSVTALDVARLGTEFWNEVIKGNAPFVASRSFYKDYPNPYGFGFLGSCGFYSQPTYEEKDRATTKENAKYVACGTAAESIPATNANGEYKACTTLGELCNTAWSYRVRLHPDATDSNKFTIYTQTREAKYTAKTVTVTYPNSFPVPASYDEARTHYGAAFPGNAAIVTTKLDSNGNVSELNLTGELSPAFTITSNPSSYYDNAMKRWVYKSNTVAAVLGDKHNVALSAMLTKVGDLAKLALSGSIDLIKAGALESRLELASGSYLQARPDAAGNYEAQNASQEMLLKLKGGTAASTLTGELKMSAFKSDKSGTDYIPTLIAFNGSVQRNGVAFLEGELTAEALNHASFDNSKPHSASNVQTTRAGFTGRVTIANRPELNVKLSATQNDTGSSATQSTMLTGQYRQGLIVINVSGSSSAAANTVTLESPNGLKLVIDKSKTVYPLTNDGQAVGQYSTSSNRVTYADSSYEQF